MRTIRRLYLYVVAFISLEVLLWGMISLARSIFCNSNRFCAGTAVLSQGLAAVLVGIPFFAVHWWLANRSAGREAEERAAGVRAVFLYAILLGTLIPIVQNLLSLLDRLALQAVGLSSTQAFWGSNQSWSDNLIAILMNALFAAYFMRVLRADWRLIQPREAFADVRRLYRHLWLAYTLVIVVAAVEQLLRFIISTSPSLSDFLFRASGAHGVVLALVGVPLWYFAWKTIQDSQVDPVEQDSLLRLGMLYLFALAGVITVLSSSGVVLNVVLRAVFGEALSVAGFLSKISVSFSIGIPLAGVWAYYGHWLNRAIDAAPDEFERAGRRRLYNYILSAVGLAATFTGLALLLSFVVDASFGNIVWADSLRPRLAVSLAALLVALPLWGLNWRPLQAQALGSGDAADHARRSLLRRIYLYLALFAGVVGGMVVAVSLLNLLLRSLFGVTVTDLLQQSLKYLELLFLFVGLGLYHGLAMRADGRRSAEALAQKHALFPVWVFDPGGTFAQVLLEALHKQSPRLPVVLQPLQAELPPGQPRAVLLPLDLALSPPPALKDWLDHYEGLRLLVPRLEPAQAGNSRPSWLTAGGIPSLPISAAQAAQSLRRLAEGQPVRQEPRSSGWMVGVYIAAGLFGAELLFALVSLGISLFGGG
jgi:hypothetical protein